MSDFPVIPGLSLRSPDAADQAFLDLLYASTRDDLQQAGLDPAMLATLLTMQHSVHEQGQRMRFPHARHVLLEAGGASIGRVVVDSDAQRGIRVIDIALVPQARRLGHGSAVLQALQRHAAALGMPLRLRVAGTNEQARRLYLALGFTHDMEAHAGDDAAYELVWRVQVLA
jgi:ribosomal protein S18 acetylase RimI-like enzyme